MGKRIGESTADDLHGWIFADVVYYWWRHEIPLYTGITVFLRRCIIVGHFLIPPIPTYGLFGSVCSRFHLMTSKVGLPRVLEYYSSNFYYSSTRLFLFSVKNFISGCSFFSNLTHCWNLCKIWASRFHLQQPAWSQCTCETVPSRAHGTISMRPLRRHFFYLLAKTKTVNYTGSLADWLSESV